MLEFRYCLTFWKFSRGYCIMFYTHIHLYYVYNVLCIYCMYWCLLQKCELHTYCVGGYVCLFDCHVYTRGHFWGNSCQKGLWFTRARYISRYSELLKDLAAMECQIGVFLQKILSIWSGRTIYLYTGKTNGLKRYVTMTYMYVYINLYICLF